LPRDLDEQVQERAFMRLDDRDVLTSSLVF
jgi:hypothetical protein